MAVGPSVRSRSFARAHPARYRRPRESAPRREMPRWRPQPIWRGAAGDALAVTVVRAGCVRAYISLAGSVRSGCSTVCQPRVPHARHRPHVRVRWARFAFQRIPPSSQSDRSTPHRPHRTIHSRDSASIAAAHDRRTSRTTSRWNRLVSMAMRCLLVELAVVFEGMPGGPSRKRPSLLKKATVRTLRVLILAGAHSFAES